MGERKKEITPLITLIQFLKLAYVVLIFSYFLLQHNYAPLNRSALESCHKSFAVSLSTLHQLMNNFCQSYELEIQPWTNREPPTVTALGPTCRRVDNKRQKLGKVCTFQNFKMLVGRVLFFYLHTSMVDKRHRAHTCIV